VLELSRAGGRVDHIRACHNVQSHVIDLHCHVLPGIDDGPATIEGSLALARLAAAGGTHVLVATPHVSWRYRNDAATIAERVGELNERLAAEEVLTADGRVLEVRPGAEIALTLIAELQDRSKIDRSRETRAFGASPRFDQQLENLSLGGGPWLLVEPPFTPVAPNLDAILLELLANLRAVSGHRIVLAHPERCPAFQRDPPMLERLVRAGMLTSVTAGSLGGRFGGEARRLALALAREGLLHNVASDTHDTVNRTPEIAAEIERAGLAPLARWLTVEVPAAILDGGEIPPRPATAADAGSGQRRWRRLLSR
jgi:protein-tyrosine phosphatase